MNNLIDLHTHSVLSTHAFSSLTENIDYAIKKELKYYGISEHQFDDYGVGCHAFALHNLRIVPRLIKNTKILRGCEFNILPNGEIDTSKIRKEQLDYGIASIHRYNEKGPYIDQGINKNTNAYLKALENEYITILGHIDDGRYPCDFEQVIIKAKKLHKLIEINNTSLKPTTNRLNSYENLTTIIKLCKKYQEPVIINSDAHICYDVGEYELAYKLLKECGYPENLIVNFNENLIEEFFKVKNI